MDCKLAREIPKSFCSDDETIGLVQELYNYMEQKLIKGFVAFSAIIICQQRMCCLNMFVIIRNEQGYFKDLQI